MYLTPSLFKGNCRFPWRFLIFTAQKIISAAYHPIDFDSFSQRTQISVKCDLAKNTSDEKSFEVMIAKSEQ